MALTPWKNKSTGDGGRTENTSLTDFRSQMDRLFDTYVRDPFGGLSQTMGSMLPWSPSVDVAEDSQEVTVRAEIPGIEPNDLDITIQGDQLVISGEKKESTEKRDKDYYHVESRYGSFRRVIPLPAGADPQQVSADFKNGVLIVRVQKTAAAKPKRIQVNAS